MLEHRRWLILNFETNKNTLEKKILPVAQREVKAPGIKTLFIQDSMSGELVILNTELLSDFKFWIDNV